jgi:hypothetical protein
VLLAHLLKWKYQPDHISKSWQRTIKEQRYRIGKLLKKNPSLKPHLAEIMADSYPSAVRAAANEKTDIEEDKFPTECPWSWEQIVNEDFYP